MASHSQSHRVGRALAVALAGLALVAPASIAQTTDGSAGRQWPNAAESRSVQQWPHTAESRAYSVGKGAPAAAPTDAAVASTDAGFEWGAAAIGAAVMAGLITLGAFGAAAIGNRGQLRTAR
jgi:hypothetical protein